MRWTTDRTIRSLPGIIMDIFVHEADSLYNELLNNKLRIILVPVEDPKFEGHKKRAVEIYNPEWYSRMCRQYNHFRRDRSLRALDRLRKNEDRQFNSLPYKYDMRYRQLIYERLTEGYAIAGEHAPPDDMVIEYFMQTA